jgi:hypothetical protein
MGDVLVHLVEDTFFCDINNMSTFVVREEFKGNKTFNGLRSEAQRVCSFLLIKVVPSY